MGAVRPARQVIEMDNQGLCKVQLSDKGQSLPKWAVSAMSAIAPIATELRTPRHVANCQ